VADFLTALARREGRVCACVAGAWLAAWMVALAGCQSGAAQPQIVFMSPVKAELGPAGYELIIMDLDGSNRRQLTDNDRQEFLPHFSPEGAKLAYTMFTSGGYGEPGSTSDVGIYDFATQTERNVTNTGADSYPVWSPDGRRIAFLSRATNGAAMWIMNADGTGRRRLLEPKGPPQELTFGDLAWSSDDWILFVVAQDTGGCFKTRIDKIRPDGTGRARVTDGGASCTPLGKEQCGDADPGFSPDGRTIYSSRGFPIAPFGAPASVTERRLYAFSSDAWYAGKPERDLSLQTEPSCVEGVPKASPDGTRLLLFRACFERGFVPGIYLADSAGSTRRFVETGFGADWNPTR
jgi:Tol biopolymer transport system component